MAVARSGVCLFILTSQNLSGNDMIEILIKAMVPIQDLVRKHPAPFIAKIYRDSKVEIWRDREALSEELNES